MVPGELFPGWEFAIPLLRPRQGTIETLLDNPVLIWDEPEALKVAAERLWKRLDGLAPQSPCPPEQIFLHWGEFQAAHPDRREVELRELDIEGERHEDHAPLAISTRPSMVFRNNIPAAVSEARSMVEQGYRVAFFASSQGEVERIADIFGEYSLPFHLGMSLKGSTPDYLSERAYLAMPEAAVYLVQGQVRRALCSRKRALP